MIPTAETLTESLAACAETDKGITYLDRPDEHRRVPYAQMYANALGVLKNLQDKGLQPGDELIIFTRSNEQMIDGFWACVLGVVTQYFLNMEIERYTLVTGESVITGFSRLSKHWAWIMLICNGFVPIMLWFKRVRYSIPALFAISIFINIGMWFERFVIIVTSLSHEYEPFAWGVYRPTLPEMGIVLGSFAWFGFWFLLFTRLLPPIAIQELKEVLPPPMRKKKSPEAAEAH